MNFYSLSLIFIIFLIFYFFLKNFKLFEENIAYSKHKSFGSENKQPIVLGGIYILTIFLIYNWNISIHLKLSAVFIACLGFMSDRNILPNPKLRLIIQILILLFFVFFEGLKIFFHDSKGQGYLHRL